ncbi:glycosyltransferase [Conexibacter arvalis]|uniref:Glycosyltransferase involved in cell wall biosynthesis n=1 Tax=Conexibacter arvalis TaxID=912552 RepID=A0A840IBD1_9ACTN|nr:glycosyltransferase involved in cell wall biosynthesis [Conexibacter arvalis]
MNTSPAVTVVMPTIGRWPLVRRTLEGALAQRDVELEVVVVDDGDEEPPEWLTGRPAVRHLRGGRRGVAAARNLGVEQAAGEWVAFLDDDDLWAPWKLAEQLRAATAAQAGWCYAEAVHVDPELRPFAAIPTPSADDIAARMFAYQAVPAGCSNVLARREEILAIGGFDEQFHQLVDWDIWLRLAARRRAVVVERVAVAYVEHPGSMLLTHRESIFKEWALLRRKNRALAHAAGCRFDDRMFGFWVANRFEKAGERRAAAQASLYAGARYLDPALLRNGLALLAGRRAPAAEPTAAAAPPAPDWLVDYAAVVS